MNRFVRRYRASGVRVLLPTLRARYQAATSTYGNVKETFNRYMDGKRVPDALTAWHIGESLYPDIPWMNGLCALWAFGHVGTAIGIVSVWFESRQTRIKSQQVWDAMLMIQRLTIPIPKLDAKDIFIGHHLQDVTIDTVFAKSVLRKHRSSDLEYWVERELAKAALKPLLDNRANLTAVAQDWLHREDPARELECDPPISAAVGTEELQFFSSLDRESEVLSLFSFWLERIDHGGPQFTRSESAGYSWKDV